jgi:hypothetical protein
MPRFGRVANPQKVEKISEKSNKNKLATLANQGISRFLG